MNNTVAAQTATQIIAKIKSKDFKDRLNAYDDMLNLFSTLPDGNAPEFARLSPAFEKYLLVDIQPANKEKALQVLMVFLDRAGCLHVPQALPAPFITDLTTCIIENCLSGRDSTKLKAIDCLLMLVEVIGPDTILPCICAAAQHKTPKIATYSIFTLKEVVRQATACTNEGVGDDHSINIE
ncbi:hypothetical protein SAMD00019534_115520 [Acytostelium subglobosum LB1]|uniref:hypothetical protein n=1 Tax=Acytostelium subglobosum LB1 TaxID=1410327 RepID=UPI0006448657|nr:hypothetical protein SAMD00019534_115520 [Acytostelium subglobosum LB1]GAM28376.1 hypothetical protein SAMD00019534_115520 [Acytostelium subglobosum LB1]|eukprot:XP_012748693.1 hypothetical protein SAMD00019534_115520 [Acytostelium subglobosum LB1]